MSFIRSRHYQARQSVKKESFWRKVKHQWLPCPIVKRVPHSPNRYVNRVGSKGNATSFIRRKSSEIRK